MKFKELSEKASLSGYILISEMYLKTQWPECYEEIKQLGIYSTQTPQIALMTRLANAGDDMYRLCELVGAMPPFENRGIVEMKDLSYRIMATLDGEEAENE